ncbi:MAG: ribosome maturation factor RimP [Pseudomonadota bacterium]
MDIQATLKRVEELVSPVLENLGYELIERELILESGRWVLRLYIDREGGVTIDDCERASHGIEDLIAVEEAIPASYTLEMSSPGINRPLRRRKDFEKYRGARIRLKTLGQIDGRGNFKGTLEGLDGEHIIMEIDGTRYRVPYSELAKARIEEEKIPPRERKN